MSAQTEFRYAENLDKTILCARLEPVPDTNITSEWQRCDLFPDHGPTTEVDIADGGQPVVLDTVGLQRLLDALRALGDRGRAFPVAAAGRPRPRPLSGVGTAGGSGCGGVLRARRPDSARAGCAARDAHLGVRVPVRHPRPVGGREVVVSAGRAAAPAAPRRPPLPARCPSCAPNARCSPANCGLAHAIHELRTGLGLREPMLGEIKNACHPEHVERLRGWLEEARQAARARLLDVPAEQPAPTLVLPVDQAEELFNADAGPEAPRFLELLAALVEHEAGVTPAMIVAVTIRADRYEPLQIAPRAGRGARPRCLTTSNRCRPPGTTTSSPARPGAPAPPGGG